MIFDPDDTKSVFLVFQRHSCTLENVPPLSISSCFLLMLSRVSWWRFLTQQQAIKLLRAVMKNSVWDRASPDGTKSQKTSSIWTPPRQEGSRLLGSRTWGTNSGSRPACVRVTVPGPQSPQLHRASTHWGPGQQKLLEKLRVCLVKIWTELADF